MVGGSKKVTRMGRALPPRAISRLSERGQYLGALQRLSLPRFATLGSGSPFIIALEGPNGAGKTTLCRRLARDFGAYACLGTPQSWFSKPFKARMIRDAEWFSSAMFFLSGCIEQMRVLQSRRERLVIMDRSIWSTLAVHAAESPRRLEAVLAMLEPIAGGVRVPDLTLVLEASFETCLSRIARKDRSAQVLDHLTANARFHAREQAFYDWLRQEVRRVELLNVDGANARQAAEQARALIEARTKNRKGT